MASTCSLEDHELPLTPDDTSAHRGGLGIPCFPRKEKLPSNFDALFEIFPKRKLKSWLQGRTDDHKPPAVDKGFAELKRNLDLDHENTRNIALS